MQLKPITAIVVLLLVLPSLSVAGCTVSNPLTGQVPQVQQYADAFHKNQQDQLGPNENITVWKQNENGSNAMRLQWTVVNSTTSGFYQNGTTASYSVNVKQFASTGEATKFYDNVSFGYSSSADVNATSIKPEGNIYKQVTGKDVTVANAAFKIDSFTFVTAQMSLIFQQNEFVVWGTVTVMPRSGSPTPIPATQTTDGNNTTFSSGAGFNITYDKTLKTDSSTDASKPVRVYIYLNPNETADGVLVATKSVSSRQTLSDFASNEVKELQNYSSTGFYKNFAIVSETDSTFAGKPAHTIVWSGTIPMQYSKTIATNTSVKEMQTFVVNNNMGYVITYKTISSDYDMYLAQAQRIMNSFKFTS